MNKSILLSAFFLIFFVLTASIYFGGQPNINELKKSVAPTASLYPEAKSLSGKLNFINDKSEDLHLSELTKDKWALLYFGYTSCPDICPIDLSKINLTYQMMDNKNKLQVVFVSVDPTRDIGKLDNFANAFNSSFVGLTAQQDKLVSISKALGVYHEVVVSQKLAKEDHTSHDDHSHSHYDIDHTGSYLLFNPKLELTALLTSPHEPAPMAKAIDKIIEAL